MQDSPRTDHETVFFVDVGSRAKGTALSRRKVIGAVGTAAISLPLLRLLSPAHAARGGISLSGVTMGTTYSLRIPRLPAGVEAMAFKHVMDALLETVEAQMSTYRPQSELSRFNAAEAATWFPVSPDVATVVQTGLEAARLTAGAYDPTVGPLVSAWGFGAEGRSNGIPDRNGLEVSLRDVGHQHLKVRLEAPALQKLRNGVSVDLCGIAKGFGVDRIAEHIEGAGIGTYLVEIGGEIRAGGFEQGNDRWRIGIEDPGGIGIRKTVRLAAGAIATSGDYRHFFQHRGRRYTHILDPRDGRPVAHGLASVTVIAPTAMLADALSTALMVLGPEQGLALAHRSNIAAYFIARTGSGLHETASPAFLSYLS
jgi:thiamine biosynthesis lipoprotein